MFFGDVTKQGNFTADPVVQRMFAAANDNVRPDPHALQVFYAGLGGFRLQLTGCFQVRDQGYMDQDGVGMANFMLELAYGF